MMLFVKHAVITVAVLVAFLAAMIAPVSWISQGMSDNPNDDTGRLMAFASLCVLIVCVLLVLMLSGCAEMRAVTHACKDGLCR